MRRTCVRRRTALIALMCTVGLPALGPVAHSLAADGPRPRRTYVVRSGDTLWSIAARAVGPDSDPRPSVEAIERANSLPNATVQPGQSLVIPGA